MNNHTTVRLPLRPSENSDVLYQQILGNIKRDGQGPFYTVEPTIDVDCQHSEIFVKDLE